MKEKEDKASLKYRMYVLSLRQLSSINKACQGIHSALEYANKYHEDVEYRKYIQEDKTLIMLDGGILSDLESIVDTLVANDIKYSYFMEPDLGNIITSVCFIADERVWDENYIKSYMEYYEFFSGFFNTDLQYEDKLPTYENWVEYIGGKKNEELIKILKGKRLSL